MIGKKPKFDMHWEQVKTGKAPVQLSENELKRLLREKEEVRLTNEKDMRETQLATKKRDDAFWDDLVQDCLHGTPEERFGKFLMRANQKGLLTQNPRHRPQKQLRSLVELLRFHGIAFKDSKAKPSRDDFEMTDLFVGDLFVRKSDVATIRKEMFPEDRQLKGDK